MPIGKEDQFEGVIDLIEMKAFRYDEETLGAKVTEDKIPDALLGEAQKKREIMIEQLIDFSDELMQQVIEEKDVGPDLLKKAVRNGVLSNQMCPVLCGSAFKNKGIQQLLNAVVDFLPSPINRGKIEGKDPVTR